MAVRMRLVVKVYEISRRNVSDKRLKDCMGQNFTRLKSEFYKVISILEEDTS